jgi:hypothetical protein
VSATIWQYAGTLVCYLIASWWMDDYDIPFWTRVGIMTFMVLGGIISR